MYLLCDIFTFQKNNVFFLDMKKNMVIDGYFTKIIYTDSIISLNGLYFHFPVEISHNLLDNNVLLKDTPDFVWSSIDESSGIEFQNIIDNTDFIEDELPLFTKKTILNISTSSLINSNVIKELCRIEHEIIEHYKEYFKINKINTYSLKNQLKSGSIKVIYKSPSYCEDSIGLKMINNSDDFILQGDISNNLVNENELNLILKISGIWETEFNVGITFKIQGNKYT